MRVIKSVRVDEVLWQKALDNSLNISRFLEVNIEHYLDYIQSKIQNKMVECGRRESNPGSELGRLKS